MPSTFHPWKNEKAHLQQRKTLKHPPLCKLNLSKYTCPGCSVPSVVFLVLKLTSTLGVRARAADPVRSPFQFDDNLLLSDYNLLEKVKRVAESAQRTRVDLGGHSHF
ncbi:hypothetical protein AAG906_020858 [Vitis piasezkii]